MIGLLGNPRFYILRYQVSGPTTGCSLNIVLFPIFQKYSGLWPFSVFLRCQCVYTHQASRKPALQQNWQSPKKSQNFKEKNTIFKEHPVKQASSNDAVDNPLLPVSGSSVALLFCYNNLALSFAAVVIRVRVIRFITLLTHNTCESNKLAVSCSASPLC